MVDVGCGLFFRSANEQMYLDGNKRSLERSADVAVVLWWSWCALVAVLYSIPWWSGCEIKTSLHDAHTALYYNRINTGSARDKHTSIFSNPYR